MSERIRYLWSRHHPGQGGAPLRRSGRPFSPPGLVPGEGRPTVPSYRPPHLLRHLGGRLLGHRPGDPEIEKDEAA